MNCRSEVTLPHVNKPIWTSSWRWGFQSRAWVVFTRIPPAFHPQWRKLIIIERRGRCEHPCGLTSWTMEIDVLENTFQELQQLQHNSWVAKLSDGFIKVDLYTVGQPWTVTAADKIYKLSTKMHRPIQIVAVNIVVLIWYFPDIFSQMAGGAEAGGEGGDWAGNESSDSAHMESMH